MMVFISASVTRSFSSRTPYCVTNDNIFSAICRKREFRLPREMERSHSLWVQNDGRHKMKKDVVTISLLCLRQTNGFGRR